MPRAPFSAIWNTRLSAAVEHLGRGTPVIGECATGNLITGIDPVSEVSTAPGRYWRKALAFAAPAVSLASRGEIFKPTGIFKLAAVFQVFGNRDNVTGAAFLNEINDRLVDQAVVLAVESRLAR